MSGPSWHRHLLLSLVLSLVLASPAALVHGKQLLAPPLLVSCTMTHHKKKKKKKKKKMNHKTANTACALAGNKHSWTIGRDAYASPSCKRRGASHVERAGERVPMGT